MGWNGLVGAGADELMAGGDADFAGPIATEVAAGPDGEEDAGGFDEEAGNLEEGAGREEAVGETRDGEDEEQDAEVENDEVEAAGPDRLRGFGGGAVFGDGTPENREERNEGDGAEHRGGKVERQGDGPVVGCEEAADDATDYGGGRRLEEGFAEFGHTVG